MLCSIAVYVVYLPFNGNTGNIALPYGQSGVHS